MPKPWEVFRDFSLLSFASDTAMRRTYSGSVTVLDERHLEQSPGCCAQPPTAHSHLQLCKVQPSSFQPLTVTCRHMSYDTGFTFETTECLGVLICSNS